MEQDRISQRHINQPSILQRLHAVRSNRHLRLHLNNIYHTNNRHQNLRGRIRGHCPTIHPIQRKPRRTILPQQRHPCISSRSNLELRLLPDRHSPWLRTNARLMGRAKRQHRPIQLLCDLSPRLLHWPHRHWTLTSLHHRFLRSYNLQRRRNHHIR